MSSAVLYRKICGATSREKVVCTQIQLAADSLDLLSAANPASCEDFSSARHQPHTDRFYMPRTAGPVRLSTLLGRLGQRGMASKRGSSGSSGTAATGAVEAPPPPAAAGAKPKRQRLLAPLPPGAAAAARGRGGSNGGKAAYKEPGPGPVQLPGGGRIDYQTNLLPSAAAAATLFEQLRRELPWEQRSVRVMGKVVPQPRLIAYQADGPELQVGAGWGRGSCAGGAAAARASPSPFSSSGLLQHWPRSPQVPSLPCFSQNLLPPTLPVHLLWSHAAAGGLAPSGGSTQGACGGGVRRTLQLLPAQPLSQVPRRAAWVSVVHRL